MAHHRQFLTQKHRSLVIFLLISAQCCAILRGDMRPDKSHVKYPATTLTMDPTTRVRLDAMSTLFQQPVWRVVDRALVHFLESLDEADREAVETIASRALEKLGVPAAPSGTAEVARGSPSSAVHKGQSSVKTPFDTAWTQLETSGPVQLKTKTGKSFTASAQTARDDRKVIRYFQNGKEYGRSYPCCWAHRTNCNRTWIGMCSEPLDQYLRNPKAG